LPLTVSFPLGELTKPFFGLLDEVAIFDRALPPEV
jgi:hypothetical protein